MALEITQIHGVQDPKKLNEEDFIIQNTGDAPLNLRGCEVSKGSPHSRKSQKVAKLDPGFVLQPEEAMRVVSGNPRSTVQGDAANDKVENYFLFLKAPYITRQGMVIKIQRGQGLLTQAVYDPEKKDGVGEAPEAKPKAPKGKVSSTSKKKKKKRSKK